MTLSSIAKKNIAKKKSALRTEMRHTLQYASCTKEKLRDIATYSLRICQRIRATHWWRYAHTVIAYHAYKDEPDVSSLSRDTTKRIVFLPRTLAHPHSIGALCKVLNTPRIESSDIKHYSTPSWTIKPTSKINTTLLLSSPCLLLVPGRAFDITRARLGRGGGVYDALMSLLCVSNMCSCVGLCFAMQVVPYVPVEAHDSTVHAIITERSLY